MPITFTDEMLELCRNGTAPRGAVQQAAALAVRQRQHQGRTFAHWWGAVGTTGAEILRYMRPNFLEGGGRRMRGYVNFTGTGSTPSATPGVIFNGEADENQGFASASTSMETLANMPIRPPVAEDDVVSGELEEVTVGTDSLYLWSGGLYEDYVEYVISDTVDAQKFGSNRDIIAEQTGVYGTTDQLRDRFNHVWKMRRPVLNWSCADGSYIEFDESPEDWRYIFKQSVGDGGESPDDEGPAMTIPAFAAGIYNFNIVRVYVSVYAEMSGNTDGGEIGIANRDANGTMQTFQALENGGLTFGGTGFQWYPSMGAFDPETHPYFDAPVGTAFDRVCLGARSDGSTDNARIAAFAMFVFPSLL